MYNKKYQTKKTIIKKVTALMLNYFMKNFKGKITLKQGSNNNEKG